MSTSTFCFCSHDLKLWIELIVMVGVIVFLALFAPKDKMADLFILAAGVALFLCQFIADAVIHGFNFAEYVVLTGYAIGLAMIIHALARLSIGVLREALRRTSRWIHSDRTRA